MEDVVDNKKTRHYYGKSWKSYYAVPSIFTPLDKPLACKILTTVFSVLKRFFYIVIYQKQPRLMLRTVPDFEPKHTKVIHKIRRKLKRGVIFATTSYPICSSRVAKKAL